MMKWSFWTFAAFFLQLTICCRSGCQGVSFFVTKRERCFLLDLPDDTTTHVKYESPDTTENKKVVLVAFPPNRMNANEVPKEAKPILEKIAQDKGSFSLKSDEAGEYWVCVKLDTSKYQIPDETKMDFTLKFSMGESSEEYSEVAKKEHMDELEVQVLKLGNRVKSIQKRQDYAQAKDDIFRATSESNNFLTLWASVIQIGILIISGVYQVKHLQAYFYKKKLV